MMEAGAAGEESTTEQAKEKVRETAQDVKTQARSRLRDQVDTRSTQVAARAHSASEVLRRTGHGFHAEGRDDEGKLALQAAERVERMGRYLSEADADRILRDAEDFARRRPWAVGAAGVFVGFLASRFLKASSSRRYEAAGPRAALPPARMRSSSRAPRTAVPGTTPRNVTAPPVSGATP